MGIFLLEYESTNGFVTFCRNYVSKKNLVMPKLITNIKPAMCQD